MEGGPPRRTVPVKRSSSVRQANGLQHAEEGVSKPVLKAPKPKVSCNEFTNHLHCRTV